MGKILVADDNPTLRELFREMLGVLGHEVVDASNGLEALKRLQETLPDLVLLDIQMPVLDGLTTLQHIRRDPRFSELPVIALTAFAMSGDAEKAEDAGFDDYLPKPVTMAQLNQHLERHLNHRGGTRR